MKKATPALLRATLYSLNSFWIKLSTITTPIPLFLILRSLLLFVATFATTRKSQYRSIFAKPGGKRYIVLLASTGVTSGTASILLYESVKLMPLFITSVLDSSLTLFFTLTLSLLFRGGKKPISFYVQSALLLIAIYFVISGGQSLSAMEFSVLGVVFMTVHGVLRAIEAHILDIIPIHIDNAMIVLFNAASTIVVFAIYWAITRPEIDSLPFTTYVLLVVSALTLYASKIVAMYATRGVGADLSSAILAVHPAITLLLVIVFLNEQVTVIQAIAVFVSIAITVWMTLANKKTKVVK